MARSSKLIQTLKTQLKQQSITYRVLAKRLGLSESAIKHMFSSGNISLKRMDAICEVLQIELSDLAELAISSDKKIDMLSIEQERELIADERFLLVAFCIVNYWSMEDIIERYTITEAECIQHLAKMDRMMMIELQPNNRVRLRISNNFSWQANGPIEKYFRRQVQNHFLNAAFNQDAELRLVMSGSISRTSRLKIIEKLNAVGELFNELSWADRKLPIGEREGTSMVTAIRTWQFAGFAGFEREI